MQWLIFKIIYSQFNLFFIIVIFITAFFPLAAHSTSCGNLSVTYPLYSDTNLSLLQDISVNGNTVSTGQYTPNAAIDITANISTNVSLTLPDLDPSPFPSNSADDHNHITSSTIYDSSTDIYFHDIKARAAGISVTFTGGGPFHLNKLYAEADNVTFNFEAGIYYLDEFKVGPDKDNITVNIINGPVIFHIGTEFKIEGSSVNINVDGNVDDFLVYLHSGATFESTKGDLDFTGLIYGPNNVQKVLINGENNSFHGAINIAGGPIEINKTGTSFIYTASDQTALSNISSCNDNQKPETTCGLIPATYPQYSSSEINISQTNVFLNGSSVNSGVYHPKAAIDSNGVAHTNVSQALPNLDPLFFPSNPDTIHNHLTSSTTFNHTTEVFFHDIKAQAEQIDVSFTGGGPFHIHELNAEQKSVHFNFAAGTYYIDKFKVKSDKSDITINITSGPVILHIGSEFKFEGENVNINLNGNVEDLIVYLHAGSKFESTKRNFNFTGLIYGPDNVNTVIFHEENTTIHGAIIIDGGPIQIQKANFFHTYSNSDRIAISKISTCSNGGGGGEEIAESFNCIETTAIDDNAAIKQIYTKLPGTSFNLDIVALKNNTVIKNNYNKTVLVEIIDQSNGNTLYSDGNFQFVLANKARKQLSLQIDNPYRDLICRITYTAGVTTTVGESDNFSVRPTSLTVASNLTNSSSSGTPKAKAGENFTLTATAITGYNGTPKINNANILAHAGAVQAGTISGSFNAADSATGIATGNTFSYSEVGSLQFTAYGVYDDSFTAVDQPNDCTNDFSNAFISGKVGCKFGNTSSTAYFGRFTPDHFEITATQDGSFSDACTGFSYSGQSIGYTTNPTLTVTAYNAIGGITQNYRQSYAKLDPVTDFNVTAPTTDTTQLGADATNKVNLTWTLGTSSLTDNLDGSLTFAFGNDSFKYQHEANSLIAPFPATVDLTFTTITDSDSIATQGLPQALQPSGTSMRFGRLNINNAHGSELSPLPVPIYTEYYNGIFFIAASDDSCTTVNLAQLRFNGAVTPSLGATTVSAGLNFTAPGTGNTGHIDITTDLFIASFPWLSFDWNGNGSHDNSPSARASFGLYKGNSKQIYFREIY